MEAQNVGFIQEALRGFLRCLGLDSGGVVVVNNPLPPSSPPQPPLDAAATTDYEPLTAADDNSTEDPLVNVLSSANESASSMMTTDSSKNDNAGGESNFNLVTIEELLTMTTDTSGAVTEAHYVEIIEPAGNMNHLLTTRLISSGGPGSSH